jgi:hypothetical protein
MVEELEELKEDVEKTIGRVAAEYSYARDLQNQLKNIENEEPDKALRDVKKGLRILRWVGRSERRVDQSEKAIIKELKALGKIIPENLKDEEERLLKQLEVAEKKLVKAASIFTGDLKKELLAIQTNEQLLEKLEKDEENKIHQNLQRLFREAEMGIAELIKWIKGTEAILEKIEGFEQRLERMAA